MEFALLLGGLCQLQRNLQLLRSIRKQVTLRIQKSETLK